MLKPTILPPLNLHNSNELDTTSAIDSRGDYPQSLSCRSLLSHNGFSFQSQRLCDNVNNSFLSRIQSVDEDEDHQNVWCTDANGLHKHLSPQTMTVVPSLEIVSGAYTIGKTPTANEDAYFISERSIGVADGVSGWVDFGFSSRAFSNQLMVACRAEIENFDSQQAIRIEQKELSKKIRIRNNKSFMSFEMLEEDNFSFVRQKKAAAEDNDGFQAKLEDKAISTLRFPSHEEEKKSLAEEEKASSSLSDSQKSHKRVTNLDTTYVLEKAFAKVIAVGSSTAIIAILNPNNTLQFSNLGDSGFLHYRQKDCLT